MTRSHIRLEPYSTLLSSLTQPQPSWLSPLDLPPPPLTCPPAIHSFSLKPDSLHLSKQEPVMPAPALVLAALCPGAEQATQCSLSPGLAAVA